MKELEQCPFCARHAAEICSDKTAHDVDYFWVQCNNCEAMGPPADDEAEAERQWNWRQDVDDRGDLDVSGTR